MTYLDLVMRFAGSYFDTRHNELLRKTPIPNSSSPAVIGCQHIALPEWAADLGVDTPPSLLVPRHCLCDGEGPSWSRVDWHRAAFDMLTCQAELSIEQEKGSVHSYAFRLPKELSPYWSYAWVNRILLFLRRWVAHREGLAEEQLFGPRPRGRIHLTHDVDYVSKTLALRIKQVGFTGFNLVKSASRGQFKRSGPLISRLVDFGIRGGDYWRFPEIIGLEAEFGLTSTWHFYGGPGGLQRPLPELILDPSYKVENPRLVEQIKSLQAKGHNVGLHQGYFSWCDGDRMKQERIRLESATGITAVHCRQHWLRFGFLRTWEAQEQAGLRVDSTLGFNDRPGFRNGAALLAPAWLPSRQRFSDSLRALPMVLMDSHLFDYGMLSQAARRSTINRLLDEVAFVGGEASVIWHQRVFHPDYGWDTEYRYLLQGILERFGKHEASATLESPCQY
ncbi:MAG: hypothetical protein KDI63_04815 [Gammaproteobacteria bacterium]|nr:hypothetical protein [Gammaproteobacteria bacterium]